MKLVLRSGLVGNRCESVESSDGLAGLDRQTDSVVLLELVVLVWSTRSCADRKGYQSGSIVVVAQEFLLLVVFLGSNRPS